MAASDKRVKTSSVLAFLFMPQFRLSMQGFGHIVPVMMRTIAIMFEQAGLIAANHPATRYGMEGVRKYKFTELLGEAWYTLRTTRAQPWQWAAFSAVMLMITMIIASISALFLRIVVGLGTSAQAQIFDHPTLGNATSTAAATTPGTGMFDKGAGSADLAIMVLDKMLRQGAAVGHAGPQGGPLQQALGAFFQVYNTGVLLIAGVMLFWMVLSVVVDTAKTGTIGGGRHNMVWAPIRIVFALGLIIPLGSAGFSSGQYMVMKLAEWGSNFGTRAWVAYVGGVVNNTDVLVNSQFQSPSQIVNGYVRMWLCRVSYNAYTWQATGAIPAEQLVRQIDRNILNFGSGAYAFTNDTATNLCGTVNYKTNRDPARILADDPNTSALGSPWASDPVGTLSDAVVGATNNYLSTTLDAQAQSIACQFAAEHILDATTASGQCTGAGFCNTAGADGDGNYPDYSCVTQMMQGVHTAVNNALTAGQAAMAGTVSGPALVNFVERQGWAGMGIWYHQISALNTSIIRLADPQVTIASGDIEKPPYIQSEIGQKVSEILSRYDTWWAGYQPAAPAAPALAASSPAQLAAAGRQTPDAQRGSIASLASGFSMNMDETAAMDAMANVLANRYNRSFIVDIVQANNSNTYPLAELTRIGTTMIASGLGMVATQGLATAYFAAVCEGSKTIPIIGAASAAVGCFAHSLIGGSVGQLVAVVGKAMAAGGLILAYYVPIIPFIRVAMAVLTWMISVFEAVVMVPIAALAHMTTQGEGLAGQGGRTAWILWLNVLMRPVLTVAGYIAALLIFNTFVVYFHLAFAQGSASATINQSSIMSLLSGLFYTVIYVGTIYTVANTAFKLLDLMPNAMMRWMGGSADQSFDQDKLGEGLISAGGSMLSRIGAAPRLNKFKPDGSNLRKGS